LWGLGERKAAFHLVRQAYALLPDDPALLQVHREIGFPTKIGTTPQGAEVWAAEYGTGTRIIWGRPSSRPASCHRAIIVSAS
jgi:hypothetical protein